MSTPREYQQDDDADIVQEVLEEYKVTFDEYSMLNKCRTESIQVLNGLTTELGELIIERPILADCLRKAITQLDIGREALLKAMKRSGSK